MTEPALTLQQVEKSFDKVRAVDKVDLEVNKGEFFALLGPSGSGKTTLLRIIAGLETPGNGAVYIGGHDVTRRPPYARGIGMVFQDFLLFPHKIVAENISFPLKMQGLPQSKQREQLNWVLSLVRMEDFEDRYPHQLSGGQKQRVALARGLVSRPEILLLDEPLANLDLELRKEMEVEMRRFQAELDIPFIYVTHNQEEALTLSSRMAVMHEGKFEQVGAKLDLYNNPRTRFVASFLGSPNHVQGQIKHVEGDIARLDWKGLDLQIPAPANATEGDKIDYFLKHERVLIQSPQERERVEGENCFEGTLRDIIFKGQHSAYFVVMPNGEELVVSAATDIPSLKIRHPVEVSWLPEAGDAFLTEED
jgi:putative spermidine/putrescine transport system ATP-binding protein/spermidine/putrescine transport system ATP-binding protein